MFGSCSAGVGRVGCFIALDILVLHIKDHDWVDIYGLACKMRQHRNHMIQTEVSTLSSLMGSIAKMTINLADNMAFLLGNRGDDLCQHAIQ